MRVLCFGGTFNPIHHGHLIVAQWVAEAAGFDRVLLIPSANPPHKSGQADVASAEDRLTMCRLAVQNVSRFAVSDIELRRVEPSYTLNTLRELRKLGWGQLYWLIGGDTVPRLSGWYEPEALMQEVQFVVAERPGASVEWERLSEPYRSLRKWVVAAPLIDIGATEVRRRVTAGLGIDFLVPPAVAAFIQERGLYRGRA